MLQFAGLYLTFNFWMENDRIRFELVNIINYIWFHKILTRNSPNFSIYQNHIKTKKKSVKTKRRFPFHPSWLISFQTEIQCQWLKKNGLKNLKRQTKIPIFIFQCFAGDASWIQGTDHGPPFLEKKGPAIFSWNWFIKRIKNNLYAISVSGDFFVKRICNDFEIKKKHL